MSRAAASTCGWSCGSRRTRRSGGSATCPAGSWAACPTARRAPPSTGRAAAHKCGSRAAARAVAHARRGVAERRRGAGGVRGGAGGRERRAVEQRGGGDDVLLGRVGAGAGTGWTTLRSGDVSSSVLGGSGGCDWSGAEGCSGAADAGRSCCGGAGVDQYALTISTAVMSTHGQKAQRAARGGRARRAVREADAGSHRHAAVCRCARACAPHAANLRVGNRDAYLRRGAAALRRAHLTSARRNRRKSYTQGGHSSAQRKLGRNPMPFSSRSSRRRSPSPRRPSAVRFARRASPPSSEGRTAPTSRSGS